MLVLLAVSRMRLPLKGISASALAAVVACLAGGSVVHGSAFWMVESELRTVFVGATIEGQYVDGRTFTESYHASGSLIYREAVRQVDWSGRWSVVEGRFCTIYDKFGTGGCFRVRQTSANCFEFYFDTRTEAEARRSTLRRPTWTARAWRTDQLSTCTDRPMV